MYMMCGCGIGNKRFGDVQEGSGMYSRSCFSNWVLSQVCYTYFVVYSPKLSITRVTDCCVT